MSSVEHVERRKNHLIAAPSLFVAQAWPGLAPAGRWPRRPLWRLSGVLNGRGARHGRLSPVRPSRSLDHSSPCSSRACPMAFRGQSVEHQSTSVEAVLLVNSAMGCSQHLDEDQG